jgi:hypothetical protein
VTLPADLPHGYRPRVLTRSNLPVVASTAHYYIDAVKDPENRPCDVCGGSRTGLRVHQLPYRKPGLAKALAAIAAAA